MDPIGSYCHRSGPTVSSQDSSSGRGGKRMSTPVLEMTGVTKRFGRGPGADGRRLRGLARRGRRPGRRQRRRQVDADQGDLRRPARRLRHDPFRRRGGHDPHAGRLGRRSGSRPSTRTSPCATTSTSSPTCSSARRPSRRRGVRRSTRSRWSARRVELLGELAGADAAQCPHAGLVAVGRPAPVGRDRPLPARRARSSCCSTSRRPRSASPRPPGPRPDPAPARARASRSS